MIENPARKGMTYDKWLGGNSKVSNREVLHKAIDDVLMQKPRDMDEFLLKIRHISFLHQVQLGVPRE